MATPPPIDSLAKPMSRAQHPETRSGLYADGRPAADRWAVLSALVLLAIAFATEYLSPNEEQHISATSTETASDNGRGRSATSPSEIPVRGWKDILLRVYFNLSEHRVVALGAGMTFYSLLAIFPALAAFVAIYGLFSN
ncbi:MAG: hypothetical protein ACJ8EL_18855, partial [Rhizomicrobium sp.]